MTLPWLLVVRARVCCGRGERGVGMDGAATPMATAAMRELQSAASFGERTD